jgi:hypothetical protein
LNYAREASCHFIKIEKEYKREEKAPNLSTQNTPTHPKPPLYYNKNAKKTKKNMTHITMPRKQVTAT